MAQVRARTVDRGLASPFAGALSRLPDLLASLRAALAQEAEQRRLFPWLAVAFGLGILVEFNATDGPPALAAPLLAAGACAATFPFLGARPFGLALALGLCAAFLGFAAAAYRVSSIASPILARSAIGPLTGIVESLDEREAGARLIVRVETFADLPAKTRPLRVRVSSPQAGALQPGARIAATARLLPPPEAARPGGYDFARDAYFRGLGAVGSLIGAVTVRPSEEPLPWRIRLTAAIDDARNALTRRIAEAIGGQAGAVAAALVTGKRGLIAPATNDSLRAAGIYHVISISGLHMVLAAGVVFWLARAGLALVPMLALGWPIKKLAAGAAMLGVTGYCAFSGWDIAAERSLIMTLVMLGAILFDRPALSLRNLALAAMIALAREPEALLGPSFQMSFGAVAGLIACAPLIDRRQPSETRGPLARVVSLGVTAVIGTLATTLIAQLATAPFATYHFQTLQPFGVIGNALTLPLVSLAVMPAAVLGMLAYPFALDRPVWWLMGQAVSGMLAVSDWVAGFSQASVVIPAFSTEALALLAVALLIATLPATQLRLFALLPAVCGLALAASPARQDVFVDREGSGLAIRGADGRLARLGWPPAFVLEQWLRADGDGRKAAEVAQATGARCDPLGCSLPISGGRFLALTRDSRALAEDCARAAIIITTRQAPNACAATLVIDRAFLAGHGAVALRLGGDEPVVTSTRRPGLNLPWRPRPVPARLAPEPTAASEPAPSDAPPAPLQ